MKIAGRIASLFLLAAMLTALLVPLDASASSTPKEDPVRKPENPAATDTTIEMEIPVTVIGRDSTVEIIADDSGNPKPESTTLSVAAGETKNFIFSKEEIESVRAGDYYYTIRQSDADRAKPGFETTEYRMLLRTFTDDSLGSYAFATIFLGDYVIESEDVEAVSGFKYPECEFENIIKRDAETWGRKNEKPQVGFDHDENIKHVTLPNNTGEYNPFHPFTTDGTTDTPDGTRPIGDRSPDKFYEITMSNGGSGAGDSCKEGDGNLTIPAYDSKTGEQCGTYTLVITEDAQGARSITVHFTPNKDYIGDPNPAILTARTKIQTADGKKTRTHNDITAYYRPHILPVAPPVPHNADTWGKKGEKQNSDDSKDPGPIYFEKGDGEIVSIQLIDPNTGKPTDKTTIPAYDSKTGKRCGTYTLVTADPKTGKVVVVFTPDPDYVGDPKPCLIIATDEYGFTATAKYQPHVTDEPAPQPSGGSGSTPPPVIQKIVEILPPPIAEVVESIATATGDSSQMFLWGGVGAAAIFALLLFVMKRRRN